MSGAGDVFIMAADSAVLAKLAILFWKFAPGGPSVRSDLLCLACMRAGRHQPRDDGVINIQHKLVNVWYVVA